MALRRPSGTEALGGAAFGFTVGATVLEWLHVWRRGKAPFPVDPEHVLEAGAEAAREAVEVARTGYLTGSERENATLNLLLSYVATAGLARLSTHAIRRHGTLGPLRNRKIGGRHIHHFIPGIVLAFASGAASIISRDEHLDVYLAVPFGAGMALTLDEAALLVDLKDVYWSERGILSVQLTLGTMAGLGALAVGLRVLKRGEAQVLDDAGAATPSP